MKSFSPVSLFHLHRKGRFGGDTLSSGDTTGSPRPPSAREVDGGALVSFLVFRLAFSIFLGLTLGLLSAFGVVEVEA
jgi:hypothetical protein